MDLDLVKSEILRDVFREGLTAPTPASERHLPPRQAAATWPARVLRDARQAEKLTAVKTPLPKFFNPLFRQQNLINRSLIASARAGADGLAEVMHAADRLNEELELLRRLAIAHGVAPATEGWPQLRQSARAGEQMVTLPWTLRQSVKLPAGATVLVERCADNLLNLELASLGFKVIGLDQRECRDDHPNFKFLESGGPTLPLAAASVDAVVAVSCLGRAAPGALPVDLPGEEDKAALLAWHHVLKPDGALMLTLPFGQASPTAGQQIYNSVSLDKLLTGWTVEAREFALCTNQQAWFYPSPEAEASRTAVNRIGRPQAVALVLVRK
jgi:hypothetical protein